MGMTPEQIADVANYFGTKNSARLASVQKLAGAPLRSSAPVGDGSGFSGGGGDKMAAYSLQTAGGQEKLQDALNEMNKPNNLTQGILNALSTGMYASGRFWKEVGVTADMHAKEAEKAKEDGQPIADPLTVARRLAEDVGRPLAAAARGVTEGFGARYDNERPVTPGENLKDAGVTGAVDDAVKNATGNKTLGNVAAGTVGFAADIAGDPTILLGGTGVVKGLAKGAADARAAAAAGGNAFTVLAAGGKGVGKGFTKARQDALATSVARSAARVAKKDPATETIGLAEQVARDATAREEGLAATRQAAPDVAREAAPVADDITPLITPANAPKVPDVVIPNADALKVVDELAPQAAKVNPLLADRAAAVDKLLPTLSKTNPVDAAKILADATTTTAPVLDAAVSGAARAVLQDAKTVKEVDAALSALKKTKAGKAFLAQPIKVAAKSTARDGIQVFDKAPDTVEAALRRAAVRRLTGAGADASTAAVQRLLAGGGASGKVTADSLGQAITGNGFGAPSDLTALFHQLGVAKSTGERQEILKSALASSTGFKNFDEAMKAAADGQVESSMMRSMLQALGVKTKAASPVGLRTALAKQGKMNWEEIKNSIPTTQEVLDTHGVPAAVSEEAKLVNPTQAAEEAAAALDAALAEPLLHVSVKSAVATGIRKVDELVADSKLPGAESYDNLAWLGVHRSLLGSLRHSANNAAGEGAARMSFLYGRYGQAVNAVEAYARAKSFYPQLRYGAGEQPLYVSFGQIFHALPEDVISPAMFNLKHTLGSGMGNKDFELGLSVFPTTIGNGVRAAINGADTAGIRAALRNKGGNGGLNAFERSTTGQKALDRLALAISDPAFIADMSRLHAQQQTLAVGKAQLDAAATVIPLRDAVIKAASREVGDRADLVGAANKAMDEVKKMAPEGAESLTRDIAKQEVDNGIAGSLGPVGAAMIRADARSTKTAKAGRTPEQIAAALDKVGKGHRAAKTKTGQRIVPSVPKSTNAADKELRGSTAKENAAWAEDMAPAIDDEAKRLVDEGFYEDTELGNLDALVDANIQSGMARTFGGINHLFNGSAGSGAIADIRTSAVTAAKQASAVYQQHLRNFMWGGREINPNSLRAPKVTGIQDRLTTELGLTQRATVEEMNKSIVDWWDALRVHELAAGRRLTDDEMRSALQTGASGIGNKGIGGAEPLTEGMTELAMEFRTIVDMVFHPEGGPLIRAGVTSKDLMRELEQFGMGKNGPLGEFTPHEGRVSDLVDIWKSYDFATMEHPLDVLNALYHGLAAASVRPTIGSALSSLMDHVAQRPGVSVAQLKKEGYVKLDTKVEGGIVPYTNPDSLWAPDLLPQMARVNRFLAEMEKPLPPFLKSLFGLGDPITNIWKQGVTTLNPRHHVANALGDTAMNFLAGVNPAYMVKATIMMHKLGKIGPNIDITPLHAALDGVAEQGMRMKSTFHDTNTTVMIGRGDKLTNVQLTAEQAWELGQRQGAFTNAHDSLDIVNQTRKKSPIETSPNPLMAINRGVGQFSSARDNWPRLAHFVHILESRPFSSIEEAVRVAAADVNKWHPTIAAMSPFEQKYMRRTMMFYSWSRQALGAVLSTALEHPGYITLPSKFQYEQANAAGLEPESIGKPIGPDDRIPSYEQNSVYGPTWEAGLMPGADPNSVDGRPHLWGMSLSTPQLDAMTSFFGGVNLDRKQGPLQGFVQQGLLSPLNPIPKALIEASIDKPVSGIGKAPSDNYGKWALQSSGLPGTFGNMLGMNNKPLSTPEENQAAQQRAVLNWISGLKFTDYTNATAAAVANTEQSADDTLKLRDAGYSDDQIRNIKSIWKSRKLSRENFSQ